MISDINEEITSSKVISFADDTIVYSNITQADDCDNLQSDLNTIYNWALYNNMVLIHKSFIMCPIVSHCLQMAVDCGRYSLCNGTFLSSLIKDITTLAYSVVYKLSIQLFLAFV